MQIYADGKGYGVLSVVAPGEGFWVNAKTATTLTAMSGAPFNLSSANLVKGWNLVATGDEITPTVLSSNLANSLKMSKQSISTVWAWDAPSSTWKFFAPKLEAQGGTILSNYIISKGYKAFSTAIAATEGFWMNVVLDIVPQTISFGNAPTVTVGGAGNVSATASSGLTVTFASSTPTICSVSGATVTGLAAGTCTITANQAGNTSYSAASQLTQNITVGKSAQTISFGNAPTVTVGGSGTVSATASSGLTVTFASSTPTVCSVSGKTVTGLAAGTCTITANQAGNTSYSAASQLTQNITVGTGASINTLPMEGFWTGTSSTGTQVQLAILENGETFGFYFYQGQLAGALYGNTKNSGTNLSGTGFDFYNATIHPGSYSGTFSSKNTIYVATSLGTTFTGSYSAEYNQPATLATIAGTYAGYGLTGWTYAQSVPITIASNGSISGSVTVGGYSCSFSGTASQRASGKNVFNVQITHTGNGCALGNGTKTYGIAYYNSSARLLVTMALNSAKTDGLMYLGVR